MNQICCDILFCSECRHNLQLSKTIIRCSKCSMAMPMQFNM